MYELITYMFVYSMCPDYDHSCPYWVLIYRWLYVMLIFMTLLCSRMTGFVGIGYKRSLVTILNIFKLKWLTRFSDANKFSPRNICANWFFAQISEITTWSYHNAIVVWMVPKSICIILSNCGLYGTWHWLHVVAK